MTDHLHATLHTDPACPWAYSEIPALQVLRWRYGAQLDWRLVVIGLSERPRQQTDPSYTPERAVSNFLSYRRFGMPFSLQPKARGAASARACRALIAARRLEPGSEWPALRALQLAQFSSPLLLDDDPHLVRVVSAATGHDAGQLRDMLDSDEVSADYAADKAEARSAAGKASELQGKTTVSDGRVRYTAPSLVFTRGDRELEAGGFQFVEAYDVLIANLDPTLERRPAPHDPAELLAAFPHGLTTQEVTALLVASNDSPDRPAAEAALMGLLADGRAARVPVGDSAIWAEPGTIDWSRNVLEAAFDTHSVGAAV